MSSPNTVETPVTEPANETALNDTANELIESSEPPASNAADSVPVEEAIEETSAQSEGELSNSDAEDSADASLEIDQRRAKQLLDRALLLSDRGDLAGAILAARQAVALTPHEPTGHSVLGLLHERAGDLEKAIAAYEKVVQLAPQSALERDSLERLKATLASENSSVIFHFDDTELFEEPEPLPAPLEPVRPVVASTPAASSAMSSSAAPEAVVSSTTALPTAKPAPARAMITPAAPAVRPTARPVAGPPSVTPFDTGAPSRQPGLRNLTQHPSFFFKGVPVVVTTALGLLFVAWAQGVAQNRYLADLPPSLPNTTQPLTPSASEPAAPANDTPTNTVPSVNPTPPSQTPVTGGGVFGKSQPNTAPRTTTRPAGGTRVATSNRPQGTTSVAPAPVAPAQPLNPGQAAPLIPQPSTTQNEGGATTGGNGGSAFDGMPPLRGRTVPEVPIRPTEPVVQPAPVAPAPATGPSVPSGSSSQGGLFNPAAQPRGYIRVDPVRPSNTSGAAVRPSNQARIAENAASRAGAAGQNTQVISNLNRAIDRAPTGYTYQRRAMAWLEANDYSRAADDFQSAIAAFEDQIRRGQNVEDARNGINACRSGLQLALSNMRNR